MTLMWATGMRVDYGTTLIELLVVLSVLALFSTVGVAAFSSLESRRLDRESAAVHTWLRAVRRDAMLKGTHLLIAVNGTQLQTSPRAGSSPLRRSNGVELALVAAGRPAASLCFFSDGSACPGYLELSNASGQRRLTLSWLGDIDVR